MKIDFVKMHGCGNDYVYLDAVNRPEVAGLIGSKRWSGLVRRMSDRHRGIGSDGVIALCRVTPTGVRAGASVRMRMFNADGSEGKMCGNGVRCVAKFAHDRLGLRERPMRVQTGAGVLRIDYRVSGGELVEASVDMGRPGLRPRDCGVKASRLSWISEDFRSCAVECAGGEVWIGTLVSMGNPHMVIFADEHPEQVGGCGGVARLDLARIGPKIERHPAFGDRINVHFVEVRSKREAVMRTWERGSGITQACGTGACAAVVAGVLTGLLGRSVRMRLPGGDLDVRWDARSGRVVMTGPAEEVFEGVWVEDGRGSRG
ncbi:MAG: diaminopimelate epimerase [Phycisphaerales bacterium]